MKKMYTGTRFQNLMILTACLFALACLFTINGYVRHQEQQREARFLGAKTIENGSIAVYFIKGIHPSY